MNRRDSLKAIGLTSLSGLALASACKNPETDHKTANEDNVAVDGRQPFEVARDKKLNADKFFTSAEMATITVLADIIIPKDDKSGSATDAGVPDFIEFIVKDIPDHQIPMRGGLRWLDLYAIRNYGKAFTELGKGDQIAIVDKIAYPDQATPDVQPGVSFFNRMRDLTASGFFTSKIGIADIGYKGNAPGKWVGPPEEVIRQYNLQNVKV